MRFTHHKSESKRGQKRPFDAVEMDRERLEATEEDAQIGGAVSAQGADLSLEDAFQRIRMSLLGAALSSTCVKEEPGEEMMRRGVATPEHF